MRRFREVIETSSRIIIFFCSHFNVLNKRVYKLGKLCGKLDTKELQVKTYTGEK